MGSGASVYEEKSVSQVVRHKNTVKDTSNNTQIVSIYCIPGIYNKWKYELSPLNYINPNPKYRYK
jgi:hypothetical protein